ncbi:MAG: B12-binding domain-containing radical SAM protein [Verrucomicrobiales bacterium]
MRVKFILPSLIEAGSPLFRPIKYSLFPPLGLATLAAYLGEDDQAVIEDEHVQPVRLDDDPDLVVIQVYITNASRAYRYAAHYRARGIHVCLGGLHVTALPEEAALHGDTIFFGPGEDTWPQFLADFRAGCPGSRYTAPAARSLDKVPPPRRELIDRSRYLVPNSLVVTRGCPHHCDFCYKDAFFAGGASFYTRRVDAALAEIEALPGRHLYFLDDHLFGQPRFAAMLFDGMKGMNRLWQAAATVPSVLKPGLLEKAAAAGLRSLFVGFENLNPNNLRQHAKTQNLGRDYDAAIQRIHDNGIMVNGSFVFGMDDDDDSVFDHTTEWAVRQGIETATFHILTPYPGTGLYDRMKAEGRLLHSDWDRYDTRHTVFQPARMTPQALEDGYWRAYREFYSWKNLWKGSATKPGFAGAARHFTYAAAWKKCEPLWRLLIGAGQVARALPMLESVLGGFQKKRKISPETVAAPLPVPTVSETPCG